MRTILSLVLLLGLLTVAAQAQVSTSPRTISGVVLEPDGRPVRAAQVVVVAGDTMTAPVDTDDSGSFSIGTSSSGETLVYAHKEGRTARYSAGGPPASAVTLTLVEPGTIKGKLKLPKRAKADDFVSWIGPAKVPALLPGIWWGPKAEFSGTEFMIENVPAGDIQLHFASPSLKRSGHDQVRVEPNGVATITVDLQRAESSVKGMVRDAVTRQEIPGYQAFLLLADGSPEAWYQPGPTFMFSGRAPGDRIVLITAPGYTSKRVPAHLSEGTATDLGQVLLDPVAGH